MIDLFVEFGITSWSITPFDGIFRDFLLCSDFLLCIDKIKKTIIVDKLNQNYITVT